MPSLNPAHSTADPRLLTLLRRLPLLGVPVLPADYDRCERVLPPGRGLDAATFEHTLVALLAKDETQRRTLRREVRRLFPCVPAARVRTGTDGETGSAVDGAAQVGADTQEEAVDAAGASSFPPAADPAADLGPRLLIGRPERHNPRAPALALVAVLVLLLMPANVGQPPPVAPPQVLSEPFPELPVTAPGALPEHPLARFNTWVPTITRTPITPPLPWPALLLALTGLLGLGWLWRRARTLRDPPGDPRRHRYRPGGETVLCWPSGAHRLPDLLERDQRRALIWGVRQFTTQRPTHRLDTGATVAASARLGRPEVRFEPARRLREVWLWRDTRLADPEPGALIAELDRDLTRAGLRVRHGAFSAVPDPVWLDLDPSGRRGARPTPASPLDLGGEARGALVAILTDGRGLAAALRAGGERAARLHRCLRALGTWPRCCLVDCAGDTLDLPRLLQGLGLPKGQDLTCIAPGDLPAWLAERPATGGLQAIPVAAPSADALLWAACCALPGLPITAAQERALFRQFGLPAVWRLPEAAAGQGRAGADGRRFTPAERRALLCELAQQVRCDGLDRRCGHQATGGRGFSRSRSRRRGLGPAEASTSSPAEASASGAEGLDGGRAPPGPRRRLDLALDFWQRELAKLGLERGDPRYAPAIESTQEPSLEPDWPDAWHDSPASHRLGIEHWLLELWRDPDPAGSAGPHPVATAAKELYERWRFYENPVDGLTKWQAAPLTKELAALRERLTELSAADLGDPADGRIHLPWDSARIGELPGEPRGTTLSRLFRMGFGGAAPASGRHPRLGFEVRLALGLLAGAAVGALLEPARPAPGIIAEHFPYTLDAKAESVFRAQTHLTNDGARLSAASRKLAAVAPIRAGERLDLHWSWSGVEAGTPGRDAPAPENLTPIGSPDPDRRTMLLHAGTLAEPIRACAEDWPGLSVAVIAADPWRYPADPDNNRAARQLAIQLLDSGAVDLAIIGPDWAAAARELAGQWSFVPDSQWLFFRERGRPADAGGTPAPLGRHRAQIQADYARLAAHLRERVHGVLDAQDPAEQPPPEVAGIRVLAGTPRLWGGPERETVRLADGTPMEFVTVCPGTFTMGADDLLRRRLPVIVAETLGVAPDSLTPETRLDAQTLGEETNARLRTALQERLGTSASDETWNAITHLRSADDAFKWLDQADERPAHPVLMNAFQIARTETTQAQRKALLPGDAPAPGSDRGRPAANDDWDQARVACGALRDGDLPTEAQWEYAARAGSGTAWSWGDEAGAADAYAWSGGNSGSEVLPVGAKQPNPLGLVDMHGNLWEWNRDCYSDTAYRDRVGRLVADPLEDDGGECRLRVVRGGSFDLGPGYLRSAYRRRDVPRYRLVNLGFRCVRSGPRSLEHSSP